LMLLGRRMPRALLPAARGIEMGECSRCSEAEVIGDRGIKAMRGGSEPRRVRAQAIAKVRHMRGAYVARLRSTRATSVCRVSSRRPRACAARLSSVGSTLRLVARRKYVRGACCVRTRQPKSLRPASFESPCIFAILPRGRGKTIMDSRIR